MNLELYKRQSVSFELSKKITSVNFELFKRQSVVTLNFLQASDWLMKISLFKKYIRQEKSSIRI